MTLRVPESVGARTTALLLDAVDMTLFDPTAEQGARDQAFMAGNVDLFRWRYLRSEIVSKFDDRDKTRRTTRAAAAYEKFHLAEELVGEANYRLVDPWSRPSRFTPILMRARRHVARVLGCFPWEKFPRVCGFGPGASGSLRRRDASHQNKWMKSTEITEKALPYLLAFHRWANIESMPSSFRIVDANTVTTVPKNWKTDRVIAIEPDWNAFLQKGVGSLIRHRLQRQGLLLPDAQVTHGHLARLGSYTDSLATIDLSMASDMVSLALCEALLPADWFKVVCDLRSPYGLLPDGTRVHYAKVSSMGNGFTFELETLLFYCLSLAACDKRNSRFISAYGDDIVVPAVDAQCVLDTLEYAGFVANRKKSFSSGPFRESCGGHYYGGVDVTPFYLRHNPETLGDLIVLGNNLVSFAHRSGWPDLGPFAQLHRFIRKKVPRKFWGPYRTDGCLWMPWDTCRPSWLQDVQAWRVSTVVRRHNYFDLSDKTGAYLHKLWVVNDELEGSRLARATSAERVAVVLRDREQWFELPVRLA